MQKRQGYGRSRGYTLIDLVVAIGIISVLLAVFSPAVQSARESARAASCRNNVKQVLLGIQSYNATHRSLPIGWGGVQVFPDGSQRVDDFSPIARILPYLDQGKLFSKIDFKTHTKLSRLQVDPVLLGEVGGQSISSLLCPSDAEATGSRCSYSFNTGAAPTPNPAGPASGSFVAYAWLTFGDFRDGTSHTVALSEKLVGAVGPFDPLRDIAWLPTSDWDSSQDRDSSDAWMKACSSFRLIPRDAFRVGGAAWIEATGNLYNHIVPPNSTTLGCSLENRIPSRGVVPARSMHKSSVHVGLMDGSCRSVSDSVDLAIWRAISTRAGAEVVSSF